jgi:hypothetical protein
MSSRLQVSIKQVLIITAIAAAVCAFLMRPPVNHATSLDALQKANRSSELVMGHDAAGRLMFFGGATIPKRSTPPVGTGVRPICTVTVDGKAHSFTHDLPAGFEYRIYLAKTLDAGEFKWIVFRRN